MGPPSVPADVVLAARLCSILIWGLVWAGEINSNSVLMGFPFPSQDP